MKRIFPILLLLAPLLYAVDDISVSGDPALMTINTALAGDEPDDVFDAATTYDITVDGTGTRKITGSLDSTSPSNTTIAVTLDAPTGASSAGEITLSTTASDLVTNIGTGTHTNNTITLKFSATVSAGAITSASRTITYTIVDTT